jgi:hypothetical protein
MTSESYIAAVKESEKEIKGLEISGMEIIFTDNQPHQHGEYKAYHDYATERFPNAREIRISFDGEDALLDVVLYRTPFERIRRITGYLQKTTQWNSAKQHELSDRVKHGEVE